MKIGIDIRTLMDARPSGVSEYTLNLVGEILKLDYDNEYRLFYNCFGACPNPPKFAGGNVKVVKYNYPNKIFNYLLCKIFNYPKIDKELEVDLFFLPHINFIGLSAGVKKIIAIHDLSFLRNPEFFSARKNFWHRMLKVKKLVSKFEVVTAVSENTKRDIVEFCGVSPEKIKVIYPGVGEEFRPLSIINYQLTVKKIRDKYNLPEKFILYLGTVEPRKNVEGIISAYNELRTTNHEFRNYKLIIAGAKGWKSEKIYQARDKSEFKNEIKFLGYVDDREKVYLYNLAELFVYPSFYEGFGLPPLEALACGCPVIASHVSSLPEVVGDAALLVDPYDTGDLSLAIRNVLSDESLKNKLIARGVNQAKKFSWEKAAGEYLAVFNHA